jgi:hypothetical protein
LTKRADKAVREGKSKPPAQPQRKLKLKHTLLPLPPLLGLFGDDGKRSGEEKQELEFQNDEEEGSVEEEGDEDEIEESDGAAEVDANSPASPADDAAEPERKSNISERLKRKHPGSAGVSGREEKAKRRRNSVDLQPVDIQKEYWGPPKGSKHALTQRLYKIKIDDGSLQTVLAEDTIDSEAVVVDTFCLSESDSTMA